MKAEDENIVSGAERAAEQSEIDVEELPVNSAIVPIHPSNDLGKVPGLEDEELADPAELARMVLLQDWEPILKLPAPKKRDFIPKQMEKVTNSFGVEEWGDVSAFNTADFHRR